MDTFVVVIGGYMHKKFLDEEIAKLSIEELLGNSNLPGPRGNLELLYQFMYFGTPEQVTSCLNLDNQEDSIQNSPEEFGVMCGVARTCVVEKERLQELVIELKSYANHSSWRVREAVCIGLQEVAKDVGTAPVLDAIKRWSSGSDFEKRAFVATLCEPALLKDGSTNTKILDALVEMTHGFEGITTKLDEGQTSLRKALGYCWSVAIVHETEYGKLVFEQIVKDTLDKSTNKHVLWIIKENLKKNRLVKMESQWVEDLSEKI